jgi:hypothetical protein
MILRTGVLVRFFEVADGETFVMDGKRFVKRGEYARREGHRTLRPVPLSALVLVDGKGQ